MKLKAKIYQYTGIYLAQKEELEYITSKAFWKEFDAMEPFNYDNDLTNQDLQGILIGSWQANYGFYRRVSRRFKYGSFLAAVDIFLLQLVEDVKYLLQNKTK